MSPAGIWTELKGTAWMDAYVMCCMKWSRYIPAVPCSKRHPCKSSPQSKVQATASESLLGIFFHWSSDGLRRALYYMRYSKTLCTCKNRIVITQS